MVTDSDHPKTHNYPRNIPKADRDLLWRLSAFRCAYPGCQIELYQQGKGGDRYANIGKMAHIFGHSEKGPRPNPDGFTENTNRYENLILLCANHHDVVDRQANEHTVSLLRQWKDDHERWIANRLAREEFNSADLESTIVWLSDNTELPPEHFELTPPAAKIKINDFSVGIQKHINIGLPRMHEVETYIVHRSRLEPEFTARLLNQMLTQYNTFRKDTSSANHVFNDLVQYACGNSRDHVKWLSGIVLVVYFFERCEIFDR